MDLTNRILPLSREVRYIKKYLVKKCNRLNLRIILEIPTFIDKSIYYDKELSSYCSIKTGMNSYNDKRTGILKAGY